MRLRDARGGKSVVLRLVATIVLLFGTGASVRLFAQVAGATLSGTITDEAHKFVVNAEVVITNSQTGSTQTVRSNADGVYSLPNLLPGDYAVTASAPGFSTETANLTLTVGGEQVLDLTMRVGTVNQRVEVTSEVPELNMTDSVMSTVIGENTVRELPLNGRSWTDLATLAPGVYQLHTQPAVQTGDRFTRGYGAQLSISGAKPQQNNYRVDGISINDYANGGPGSVLGGNLGVEAISEFSVLTTNYSTEYGRASGGIINAITKSGTNAFHGDVYEFLRNDEMDAANFYDNQSGAGTPEFRRNQFGASAGGPIRRDKTFIFGDYEGLRQDLGLTINSPTPSAAARAGADPKVLPYLNDFFPLPNAPACGSAFDGCFAFGGGQISSENYYIFRVDNLISAKDSLHGSFFRDISSTSRPDEFNNRIAGTASNNLMFMAEETHLFSPTLANSVRIGFHRAYQANPATVTVHNKNLSDASLGAVPGDDAPQIKFGGATVFSGGLTSSQLNTSAWNSFQYYDDASWTKARHSIKFGGGAERDQENLLRSSAPGGAFTFSSASSFFANAPVNFSANFSTLVPRGPRQWIFAGYIQDDWRYRSNLTINLGMRYEATTVTKDNQGRGVTLLSQTAPGGIPYCGSLKPAHADECAGVFNTLFKNNTLRNFEPRVGFAWDPFRSGKTSVRSGFGFYDFLPLIAFMGSTTDGNSFPFIQSGSATTPQGSFGPLNTFTPGANPPSAYSLIAVVAGPTKRVAYIQQNPKRSYVMQWNLSVESEIARNVTALVGYVGSRGLHGPAQIDDSNIVLPIPSPFGYLWPCGPLSLGAGNIHDCSLYGSGTKINPNVGRMPTTLFKDSSFYDGLQLQLTKRMSHGLMIQGNFAWQKAIDEYPGSVISDSTLTGISSLFTFDPKLVRAVSDFDIAKVFSINGLWDVPTGESFTGLAKGFLGGWEFGGILSTSTGAPFTPLLAGDPYGLNSADPFGYPDRVPNCKPINSNYKTLVAGQKPLQYINLSCFTIPAVVNFSGTNYIKHGNAGRNSLFGPGLATLDLSLLKNIPLKKISERSSLQFRVDAFNILNHANFNPPANSSGNNVLFDSTTLTPGLLAAPGPTSSCVTANQDNSGCIPGTGSLSGADGTTTTSRQLQIAAKIVW